MLRNTPLKVKIAGAGPSGLTAAICLAKAGYEVEISEVREDVGARFIGDFQVLENGSGHLDFLEWLQKIGISINFFTRPVREATLFDYRLKAKRVRSHDPFGYFIHRGEAPAVSGNRGLVEPVGENATRSPVMSLDHGLREQALSVGVKIHYQLSANLAEVDIVATGPSSADALAKEMTFLTNSLDKVWVLFDMKVAPGGYAYLFVLDGVATFGCAITRDLPQINRYFDMAMKRLQEIDPFSIADQKTGYSFMDFSLKGSAMSNQKLYVGEAGGFQDYLFGLGLRYAMITGYCSAMSLIENKNYDRIWREQLGDSQEVSLVNRALYEFGGNMGLSMFVQQTDGKDFKEYLASWHKPALWKMRLLPIVKWVWQRKKTSSPCKHPFPRHWCREGKRLPQKLGPT
ncbi:MAG: NAD(P)/FAD-dependent oxidoreductase [Nitrospirae bacterium]|nr:NAD(P)/FAD-dependent oxidoreductase [Candidatus Troglogloeales bacterium]MBI3598002.1 NAD(P)/FAD-dependent oxidoreductase [Candidatus Troglogloeales bacterium]